MSAYFVLSISLLRTYKDQYACQKSVRVPSLLRSKPSQCDLRVCVCVCHEFITPLILFRTTFSILEASMI